MATADAFDVICSPSFPLVTAVSTIRSGSDGDGGGDDVVDDSPATSADAPTGDWSDVQGFCTHTGTPSTW